MSRIPIDPLRRRLQDYLHCEEAADRFSGAVAIEHADDIVFEAAVGLAHRGLGVPNHVDTRFNIGSITKMLTAVAVLQLWERGKLELDDAVAQHLPGLRIGAIDRITIHQLLCHSSGLGMYWNERCKQRRSSLRTIQSYLEVIEGEVPAFEPGTNALYGSSGYLVLGAIIERISGTDYYDYVQQHICRVAGMERTEHLHLDQIADFAHGYTFEEWEGPAHPGYRTDNIFQYPVRGNSANAMYSTARDLLRFGAALRKHQLLRPASCALMFQPHARDAHGQAFGYGCQFFPYSRGNAVGHGGRAYGAATIFAMLPAFDVRVCILSNFDRPADKRVFSVVDSYLGQLAAAP